jgi:hypothetical protein
MLDHRQPLAVFHLAQRPPVRHRQPEDGDASGDDQRQDRQNDFLFLHQGLPCRRAGRRLT